MIARCIDANGEIDAVIVKPWPQRQRCISKFSRSFRRQWREKDYIENPVTPAIQ